MVIARAAGPRQSHDRRGNSFAEFIRSVAEGLAMTLGKMGRPWDRRRPLEGNNINRLVLSQLV